MIETLQDAGFEIARQTDKAISIKNPSGGRNIRLTGGLYERDFRFSQEVQAEVERDSESYRNHVRRRFNEATRVLHKELERKREYHQARHGEPRREANQVAGNVRAAQRSHQYLTSQAIIYSVQALTTESLEQQKAEIAEMMSEYSRELSETMQTHQAEAFKFLEHRVWAVLIFGFLFALLILILGVVIGMKLG